MLQKNSFVSIRLSHSELSELERRMELLNLTKTEYLRLMLFNKSPKSITEKTQNSEEYEAVDYSKIEIIVNDKNAELADAMADFLTENFNGISEILRLQMSQNIDEYIPYFSEYRMHEIIENDYSHDDFNQTVTLARAYKKRYEIWPKPGSQKFGKWYEVWGNEIVEWPEK
jgi:hypothetical protein